MLHSQVAFHKKKRFISATPPLRHNPFIVCDDNIIGLLQRGFTGICVSLKSPVHEPCNFSVSFLFAKTLVTALKYFVAHYSLISWELNLNIEFSRN